MCKFTKFLSVTIFLSISYPFNKNKFIIPETILYKDSYSVIRFSVKFSNFLHCQEYRIGVNLIWKEELKYTEKSRKCSFEFRWKSILSIAVYGKISPTFVYSQVFSLLSNLDEEEAKESFQAMKWKHRLTSFIKSYYWYKYIYTAMISYNSHFTGTRTCFQMPLIIDFNFNRFQIFFESKIYCSNFKMWVRILEFQMWFDSFLSVNKKYDLIMKIIITTFYWIRFSYSHFMKNEIIIDIN